MTTITRLSVHDIRFPTSAFLDGPHAGGVGLCEYVQHLSMIDYLCFGARKDDRAAEFVDHLHEHFVDPCIVIDGAYRAPTRPGYSIEMKRASMEAHRWTGPAADHR